MEFSASLIYEVGIIRHSAQPRHPAADAAEQN